MDKKEFFTREEMELFGKIVYCADLTETGGIIQIPTLLDTFIDQGPPRNIAEQIKQKMLSEADAAIKKLEEREMIIASFWYIIRLEQKIVTKGQPDGIIASTGFDNMAFDKLGDITINTIEAMENAMIQKLGQTYLTTFKGAEIVDLRVTYLNHSIIKPGKPKKGDILKDKPSRN